jgi:hypothetical protein
VRTNADSVRTRSREREELTTHKHKGGVGSEKT